MAAGATDWGPKSNGIFNIRRLSFVGRRWVAFGVDINFYKIGGVTSQAMNARLQIELLWVAAYTSKYVSIRYQCHLKEHTGQDLFEITLGRCTRLDVARFGVRSHV